MNHKVEKPSLMRQLAAIFYDLFLLIAVVLVAASVFTIILEIIGGQGFSGEKLQSPMWKIIFQLYLLSISGLFFTFFWVKGGQTLGMKVWKIQLVTATGQPPGWAAAWRRLFYALPLNLLLGYGLMSRLFNADSLTLYDRLSGTHLINKTEEHDS